ncbi:hypothetical protein EAE96_000934 [Botrytis aclada]|nr:hypothetical protein EAE96_000934 [Botrytis aclada]
MPAGHSAKTHHCPGMKTMKGNCRMEGKAPHGLKYCLTHQCYCPICAASPFNKDYAFLFASDTCSGRCGGYKHPDHKENVKAREDAEKKAKEAAKEAKIEDGKAKVAAKEATAAARRNARWRA